MTFDLEFWPTNLNINRGHLLLKDRTIYLPKPLGQSVRELYVAQGEVDWHDLWPTDLNINRGHPLMQDYLPTKFEASGAKCSWVISCTRWSRLAWPLTLTCWPECQWGHLLIQNYLPTKFEASWAKHSCVISCARWSRLAWPLILTFDLLTWISKGVIYSSRTVYLPSSGFSKSLKVAGESEKSRRRHMRAPKARAC